MMHRTFRLRFLEKRSSFGVRLAAVLASLEMTGSLLPRDSILRASMTTANW